MRKPLSILLIAALILFSMNHYAMQFYGPKANSSAVIIYTTDWCPYCEVLRETLDTYQVSYIERDTEKSLHGFLGYWALRGQGVPISVIGEEVIHGYDGQIITDALVGAGHEIPADWPTGEHE